MSAKKLAYGLLAGLLVTSIAQHAWYWPQLPERVATHFGIDGQPNDWMSRSASTLLLCSLQLGVPLFLLGVTLLADRLPDSMVNIPHREFWLHPDRRDATLAHMNTMMAWISVMTSAFMIVIGHVTFIANKNQSGLNVPVFVSALVAYLAGVFTMAAASLRHFRLPASER